MSDIFSSRLTKMNVPHTLMDLDRVTDDLPLLARLPPDRKNVIINGYMKILADRSFDKVRRLLERMEGRLTLAKKANTEPYRVLQDQYQRIINILKYHMARRPATDFKY